MTTNDPIPSEKAPSVNASHGGASAGTITRAAQEMGCHRTTVVRRAEKGDTRAQAALEYQRAIKHHGNR